MKLTIEDKKLLTSWGYLKDDLRQIEKATLKTKTQYECDNKKISLTEVLKILDRETYLSGISRSAFHRSTSRQNNKGQIVYFDSSKLFE